MLPEPDGDDGVNPLPELPLLDFGEPCADVFWKWVINRNPGHVVGGVPKPLEILPGLAFPPKAGRVAGFHVDADDLSRVVVHRVSEAAMAVFYTGLLDGLLDVLKDAGRGWLPAVVLFGFDACRVIHAEGPVGEGLAP